MDQIFIPEVIGVYLALVVLVERVVEAGFTPIIDALKFPKVILMYIAWALAAAVIFSTGLNLFEQVIVYPFVGELFTAIVVGGGSNLLHDLFDVTKKPIIPVSGKSSQADRESGA